MTSRSVIFAVAMSPCCPFLAAGGEAAYIDNRMPLHFAAKEKESFLREMRQMLASIQGVVAGIALRDREQIIASACYLANRMARAVPGAGNTRARINSARRMRS